MLSLARNRPRALRMRSRMRSATGVRPSAIRLPGSTAPAWLDMGAISCAKRLPRARGAPFRPGAGARGDPLDREQRDVVPGAAVRPVPHGVRRAARAPPGGAGPAPGRSRPSAAPGRTRPPRRRALRGRRRCRSRAGPPARGRRSRPGRTRCSIIPIGSPRPGSSAGGPPRRRRSGDGWPATT